MCKLPASKVYLVLHAQWYIWYMIHVVYHMVRYNERERDREGNSAGFLSTQTDAKNSERVEKFVT